MGSDFGKPREQIDFEQFMKKKNRNVILSGEEIGNMLIYYSSVKVMEFIKMCEENNISLKKFYEFTKCICKQALFYNNIDSGYKYNYTLTQEIIKYFDDNNICYNDGIILLTTLINYFDIQTCSPLNKYQTRWYNCSLLSRAKLLTLLKFHCNYVKTKNIDVNDYCNTINTCLHKYKIDLELVIFVINFKYNNNKSNREIETLVTHFELENNMKRWFSISYGFYVNERTDFNLTKSFNYVYELCGIMNKISDIVNMEIKYDKYDEELYKEFGCQEELNNLRNKIREDYDILKDEYNYNDDELARNIGYMYISMCHKNHIEYIEKYRFLLNFEKLESIFDEPVEEKKEVEENEKVNGRVEEDYETDLIDLEYSESSELVPLLRKRNVSNIKIDSNK